MISNTGKISQKPQGTENLKKHVKANWAGGQRSDYKYSMFKEMQTKEA